MKYNNPLVFLIGAVLALFSRAKVARFAILAIVLLLVISFESYAAYKPPQAPALAVSTWVVTDTAKACKCADCPCGIPDCSCGCCEGKECTCLNVRQGRPSQTDPEFAEYLAWKKAKEAKPAELNKSYAKQWAAEGWVFNEAGRYWYQPTPTAAQGNCASGSCGTSYAVPMQSYAPQMQYQPAYQPSYAPPMQSFGGFGGGSSGGCSGGSCR